MTAMLCLPVVSTATSKKKKKKKKGGDGMTAMLCIAGRMYGSAFADGSCRDKKAVEN
jgi:hypothetical protein